MNRITGEKAALRLDDVGASTKHYEVYSNYPLGNWLFLKYLKPFKKWGPYREMRADEWYEIYKILKRYHAKLTVAVTAAWAESEERIIPFPIRFAEEARALKDGVREGLIEIANHGLTHCVLKDNAFKPRWFSGNRRFHREFWDWIPLEIHEEHLRQSQEILQNWFEVEIVTFIPPGNVYTEDTLEIAYKYGLRYVCCHLSEIVPGKMVKIGDENIISFHDREIVMHSVNWLEHELRKLEGKGRRFCLIREIGEELLKAVG